MKKWICILLVIAVAVVTLTACGQKAEQMDRVDVGNVKHITISVDGDEQPEKDIVKRAGITELVDLYNSARFYETDAVEIKDIEKLDTLYFFRFYDFDENLVGECVISPDGYLYLPDDKETLYELKDGFDEEAVKEIIKQYDINSRMPVM